MKVDLYNKKGKKTSKIELNDKVFSIKPNEHTIYLAVKSELASRRQGTSSSKTRGEVRGGGAKPWKQKGTGRARIGSTRNPSRVHGGSAFGPKPRQYNDKINRKVKNLARKSALSQKVKSNSFRVVDSLLMDTFKTKDFSNVLDSLEVNNIKLTMIVGDNDNNLYLSCRNLNNIRLVSAKHVSTYDIINSNMLLFDKTGVEFLNENL
tara:strand:- start:62847 stop:63467 length:621 start_codon:yes stop_codon:yes gene_type:complete